MKKLTTYLLITILLVDDCFENNVTQESEHEMLFYLIKKYKLNLDELKKEVFGPKSKYQLWRETVSFKGEDSSDGEDDSENEKEDNEENEKEDNENDDA